MPLGPPRKLQGLHVPLSQQDFPHATVLLTATHEPSPLLRPLRETVRELLPDVAIDRAQTLAARMEEEVRPFPALGLLTLAFGLSGLFLAIVGVYGVTSFTVQQRTREFGIRLALGAQPSDVLRLICRQGVWQLALGLGAGAATGWAISQPLARQMATLAEQPGAVLYLLIFAVIVLTVACAWWIPARRATKVDPLVALRHE